MARFSYAADALGIPVVLTVATHLPFVLPALPAWVFLARRHHAPYRHR